ncbi:MAG: hypothetical protein QOI74_556 [Micromonosporaceae bacterium]|nr:hypothetical protein [Micromonosporaceae bacterium]
MKSKFGHGVVAIAMGAATAVGIAAPAQAAVSVDTVSRTHETTANRTRAASEAAPDRFDLAAVGATARSSRIGYTFTAHLGITNSGPANLGPSLTNHIGLKISFGPAEAVAVDKRCVALTDIGTPITNGAGKPGAHRYLCTAGSIPAGHTSVATLTLKVTAAIQDWRIGTATVTTTDNGAPVPGYDDGNHTNDAAPIALDLNHDQNGASTDAGTSGNAGDELPITGPNTLVIVGGGAALLAVGVGLCVTARRRRVWPVND